MVDSGRRKPWGHQGGDTRELKKCRYKNRLFVTAGISNLSVPLDLRLVTVANLGGESEPHPTGWSEKGIRIRTPDS